MSGNRGLGPAVAGCLVALAWGNVVPAGADCESRHRDLVDPLLGTWHELEPTADGGETLVGTLTVEALLDGCAVSQRFESADGSFAFVTLATVDEERGVWVERMLFSTGESRTYLWRSEGEDIVFERVEEDGSTGVKRLRATGFGEDGFVVVDERSEDGGRTWRETGRTPTRPVGIDPNQ